MKPYYVTTPIYYVNDRPHIGHCYSTLVADAAARFVRLARGGAADGVFFLTGTDEHADKVVTSAASHGLSPLAWADQNAQAFREAFAFMGCANDDFIRTTEARHKDRVHEYVAALIASGAIYKGTYEGWYDENQEEYLTETAARDAKYQSPVTGRPLVRRSEACYFFRLARYQERLEALFEEHPGFVRPEARRNEVLGRLRAGLNDVPISRPVTSDPATQFGIRVPGDEAHRIYVWIDALFNYLSVVDTDARRAFWPPDVHVIAKDILWFHAVIWPAMLMALRETGSRGSRFAFVDLPRTVYSHSYWVRDGKKMSKSLGNFVTLEVLRAYATRYSLDAVRWYLLTQGPLGSTDADFSHQKFVEAYNADLANGFGNCASRVGTMIEKYFDGALPAPIADKSHRLHRADASPTGTTWAELCRRQAAAAAQAVENDFDPGAALASGMELVRAVDGYINATAPFKIAKTLDANPGAREELATILYNCAEAVRVASLLLAPALINQVPRLWEAWGLAGGSGGAAASASRPPLEFLATFAGAHGLRPGHRVRKGEPLFMRADPAEAPPA